MFRIEAKGKWMREYCPEIKKKRYEVDLKLM